MYCYDGNNMDTNTNNMDIKAKNISGKLINYI